MSDLSHPNSEPETGFSLLPGVIYEWTPEGITPVEAVMPGLQARSSARPPEAGSEPIDGYRLVEQIGVGTTGEVWRAVGPGGVAVALKFVEVVHPRAAQELRSLGLMLHVRHANLVTITGVWESEDWIAIGMDLADGSLWDRFEAVGRLGESGLEFAELTDFLRQAARGIDFLNEARLPPVGAVFTPLIHRDIKPQNLLVVGGSVKVGDFGLVKRLGAGEFASELTGGDGLNSLVTAYTAPEVRRGQVALQSDQYSLAATYCHLRGGRTPAPRLDESEPIDLAMLPAAERPAVARALAALPADRWPNCSAFVEALVAASTDQTVAARGLVGPPGRMLPSWRRIAVAAALVAVGSLAAYWSVPTQPPAPAPPATQPAPIAQSPPQPIAEAPIPDRVAIRPGHVGAAAPTASPSEEVKVDSVVETTSIAAAAPPGSTPRTEPVPLAEPAPEVPATPVADAAVEAPVASTTPPEGAVATREAPEPGPSAAEISTALAAWEGAARDRLVGRFESAKAAVRTWAKSLPRPTPPPLEQPTATLPVPPVEPPAPKTATIIVRMPSAKAELVVRGEVGRGNPDEWYGPRRIIHSPPLVAAQDYLVGAFWTDPGGQPMTRSLPLKVEPGRLYEVDLRAVNPTAHEVPRPLAP